MTGKNPSKYAIRMMKLSGRIFNEYIRPPMPVEISSECKLDPYERQAWASLHYQNEMVVKRTSSPPFDFSERRTANYYPPHPQVKRLMATLREHGLYRYIPFIFSIQILLFSIFQ